ncbi:hypothetical protein RND81_08G206000 [Saponaria officinalis]|uniref:Alpha/beta hydrolase fold-3 domain-containing protein n=1 Tax=Saponaria officinalis TaxID=3572 RepID=A0AAW1JBI0_SAPOF
MSSKMLFMLVLLGLFIASFTIPAQSQNANAKDVRPYILVFDNGTIVRDDTAIPLDPVPPQTPDPLTNVTSKDVTLNPSKNLTARIYLPALTHNSKKLPILVYFHGGGFCVGSAFSRNDHLYLNSLVSQSGVIAISINFRLYPEVTFQTSLEDAWFALEWVASQKQNISWTEPWLASHGDFSKLFLGGDSSGATIVHNLAIKASQVALLYDLRIYGAILVMPLFLGSERVPLESDSVTLTPYYRVWPYVCPNCSHGVDNPFINPVSPRSPTLRRLAVKKLLVYTAEQDPLLGRSVEYVTTVRASRWEGILAYYEAKNVSHIFHITDQQKPESEKETKLLIKRLSQFLQT